MQCHLISAFFLIFPNNLYFPPVCVHVEMHFSNYFSCFSLLLGAVINIRAAGAGVTGQGPGERCPTKFFANFAII